MSVGDYLARLAVALPLVVLLLAGLWYAARRGWIGAAGTPAVSVLRPVATLALGSGARLIVVEFDGRRLLLAASRTATTLLDAGERPGGTQP